jgi:hypothetical protein
VAIGLGIAAFLAVAAVTLSHVVGGGPARSCAFPAPIPSLSPQLRSLGGFDQGYDPQDRQVLTELAVQAASASAPGLVGAVPVDPVSVASATRQKADAIVVPLVTSAPEPGKRRISGLVAFLIDCSQRAYFAAIDDLSRLGPAQPQSFPAVGSEAAARRLGIDSPQLVYTTTPFSPSWRNPMSGAMIRAG